MCKRPKRTLALAAIYLVIQAPLAIADGTVAPLYPGAVADRHAGDVTVRVYLSHAAPAKVEAWYAGRVGAMNHDAGVTLWNADGGDTTVGRSVGQTSGSMEVVRAGHVTMDQGHVVRQIRDMTMTKDIGVLCEALRRNAQNGDAQDASDPQTAAVTQQLGQLTRGMSAADLKIAGMSDLFKGLRIEADAGLHGHTQQELLAVYAKYRHLERDWYPTVKTADGLESYDRWALAREEAKLGHHQRAATAPLAPNQDMAALAQRIQAAAMAGDYAKAQALGRQMQGGMPSQSAIDHADAAATADTWNDWMTFLQDLDRHAYATRIRINTPPQTWGY